MFALWPEGGVSPCSSASHPQPKFYSTDCFSRCRGMAANTKQGFTYRASGCSTTASAFAAANRLKPNIGSARLPLVLSALIVACQTQANVPLTGWEGARQARAGNRADILSVQRGA